MAKEETKHRLLEILADAHGPSTLAVLAAQTGVSCKSIRNYLEELERDGTLGELRLVKKPGIGVYLEGNEWQRAGLCRKLAAGIACADTQSPEARHQYILKTLFQNRYTYTMQLLADDLYVSKSTIVQDLAAVQSWLEQRGLRLERKPNRGLWIAGDEGVFREALLELCAQTRQPDAVSSGQEIGDLDCRIDFVNYQRITQMFPRLDVLGLQTILQQAEQKLGYVLTDEAFINLLIHIAIAIDRTKQGKAAVMEEARLERLTETGEFAVASEIAAAVETACGLQMAQAEAGYIALHLLGSRVQQDIRIQDYDAVLQNEKSEYAELAEKIIVVAGDILGVDFSRDRMLLAGLALHLRPTVMRLRYGMRLRNPVLERIKGEYTGIFGAAWAAGSILERMTGVTVNEDEVGHIAVYIGAAMERMKRRIKTAVLCASGVGTAQLVAVRLERELPELEIVTIAAAHRLEPQLWKQVDLVVSTVGLREKQDRVVVISTLVDSQDICAIRAAIGGRARGITAQKTAASGPLGDLIHPDWCFSDDTCRSKQEMIRYYGGLLRAEGCVSEAFIPSVLKRERITSTAIGRGTAIPHATDDCVLKSRICVVKLRRPLDWGGENVDLVFLLALKFGDAQTTQSFFRTFYALIDDENVLRAIRGAVTGREIAAAITGKEGQQNE